MKKRILFIFDKRKSSQSANRLAHAYWTNECSSDFDITMWGNGFGETSIASLNRVIDTFKPDYIYCTLRSAYQDKKTHEVWLPDLSSIRVPKIYVEVDTWEWKSNDDWYSQFDKIYCRIPKWGKRSQKYVEGLGSRKDFDRQIGNADTWINTPFFRWSVSESLLNINYTYPRNGVYFIGRATMPMYEHRIHMSKRFKHKIKFKPGPYVMKMLDKEKYWQKLCSASALVCPTESAYGDFIPSKLFEYAASGAAVVTNCDLKWYDMSDLEEAVIKYTDLDDLDEKLSLDFTRFYGKCREVMRNHTHRVRYKEIFI